MTTARLAFDCVRRVMKLMNTHISIYRMRHTAALELKLSAAADCGLTAALPAAAHGAGSLLVVHQARHACDRGVD